MKNKLLVVDDEPAIAKLLTKTFSPMGYTVASAKDGEEALNILKKIRPSLMLLDLSMPGLDGMDVLRTALEHYPDLPIIVVTGSFDAATAKRVMEAGARDYVTKPIDLEYLKTTVSALSL